MKLSVVALFCDKDKGLINNWAENAEKNIRVEHELIAVDNTSDGSLETPPCVRVVRGASDLGCFQGRRRGCEASEGEYIFFVDGDDDILPITKFDFDTDVVCFNYMCTVQGKEYVCKDPYHVSYRATADSFYHWKWKEAFKNMVWNKFVRRELLMSIYPCVPEFELYTSEDAFLSVLIEMQCRSVFFDNHAYYRYYKNNGMSEGGKIKDVAQLDRLFRGTKYAWTCYNLMTTPEQREESGIKTELIIVNLCKYALEQAYRCQDIRRDYARWLCEYFSKDFVLNVLDVYKGEWDEWTAVMSDYISEVAI